MSIGLLPLGLGATAISKIVKRKQERKTNAAKNVFSQNFPLSEDIPTLENNIAKADADLKKLNAAPTKNAAQRKSKALNIRVLSDWIITLKEELRDNKAEAEIIRQAQAKAQAQNVAPSPINAITPILTPSQVPIVANQTLEVGQNMATPTKKGVNWLLIAGVGVGGYILYQLLKNK